MHPYTANSLLSKRKGNSQHTTITTTLALYYTTTYYTINFPSLVLSLIHHNDMVCVFVNGAHRVLLEQRLILPTNYKNC